MTELIRFIKNRANSDELALLKEFCVSSNEGRGIWKTIDENREVLEFIRTHAPNVLKRCPWIESWTMDMDIFLNGLKNALGLPDSSNAEPELPRPWPGKLFQDRPWPWPPY